MSSVINFAKEYRGGTDFWLSGEGVRQFINAIARATGLIMQ